MSAGDVVPTYYFRAKQIIADLPPLMIGPDLPPGSADAEARLDENGNALVCVRADYPPALLDVATRELWTENTLMHEFGHPQDAKYTKLGRDHHARYWSFRGFPGTWEAAQASADEREAQAAGSGWQFQPRESWAECFGAALSGRWTKHEKTFDFGRGSPDALAARAFFQSLVGLAPAPQPSPAPTPSPVPTPEPLPDVAWDDLRPLPSSNYDGARPWGVLGIVDHTMVGTIESATARFRTAGVEVSATFGVGLSGRIVLWVDPSSIAYHAGNWPINQERIGIEHEDDGAYWDAERTPELYLASAALHRYLSDEYGFELDESTVGPHRLFTATACPDALDVERILSLAKGDGMYVDKAALDAAIADINNSFTAVKEVIRKLAHHSHGEPILPALAADLKSIKLVQIKAATRTAKPKRTTKPKNAPSRSAVLAGHGRGEG